MRSPSDCHRTPPSTAANAAPCSSACAPFPKVAQVDAHSAISRAEHISRENYESDTTVYTDYAMAFHIFDENGDALGEGVEVFSLIRKSDLDVDDYLDRFHDTGDESSQAQA